MHDGRRRGKYSTVVKGVCDVSLPVLSEWGLICETKDQLELFQANVVGKYSAVEGWSDYAGRDAVRRDHDLLRRVENEAQFLDHIQQSRHQIVLLLRLALRDITQCHGIVWSWRLRINRTTL